VIVDTLLESQTEISLSAARDIIIRDVVRTTVDGANIILVADSDGDGMGGVWLNGVETTTPLMKEVQIDSAGSVTIQGSDVWATVASAPEAGQTVVPGAEAIDSIRIEADAVTPTNVQVQAKGGVRLAHSAVDENDPGVTVPLDQADIVVLGGIVANVGSISTDTLDIFAREDIRLGAHGDLTSNGGDIVLYRERRLIRLLR